MNFIIPKDYKFKSKLFGLIDYQTAIFDSIFAGILYGFLNFIFTSIRLKIYLFIGLFLPFLLFSILGVQSENIVSVLIYIIKYYKKQKIYLFQKKYLEFTKSN